MGGVGGVGGMGEMGGMGGMGGMRGMRGMGGMCEGCEGLNDQGKSLGWWSVVKGIKAVVFVVVNVVFVLRHTTPYYAILKPISRNVPR